MGNQSLMISLPSCLLLTHCVCRREINMFPTLSINYALKVIVAGTAENCLIQHELSSANSAVHAASSRIICLAISMASWLGKRSPANSSSIRTA